MSDENSVMSPKKSGEDPDVVQLATCVNLEAVRLIVGNCELFGLGAGEELNELDVGLEAGGIKSPDAPQTVRVVIAADFKFRPSKESKKVLVRIFSRWVLDYAVTDEQVFERLTENQIVKFAARNGNYNVWPYLREYCQSSLGRMQLVARVLPTYRSRQWAPATE